MAIRRGVRVKKVYSARTLQLPAELKPRLDELALASGALYSQIVTTFWRTLKRSAGKGIDPRRKKVFLSGGTLQNLLPNGLLHLPSCDAGVDSFMDSMKSASVRKKTDPKARFPRKRKRYFKVVFKSSAIRVRNGRLLLSTGDKTCPLNLPWAFPLPISIEIGWKAEGGYELRAMYQDTRAVQAPLGDGVAGLDIGELRLAAVYDGERVDLHSGRLIRARNHSGNKHQARLDALTARKKYRAKAEPAFENPASESGSTPQAGQTCGLHERRVQTIAFGDMSGIRLKLDHGSKGNQQRHSWVFSKFLSELHTQARRFGLNLVLVDEAYTSQTYSWTGARKKAQGRVFRSPCGEHVMDRDRVGAVNIRAKYLETRAGPDSAYGLNPALPWSPVLDGMAPSWPKRTPSRRLAASTRGVRFRVSHAAFRRGEVPETSRIPGL